MVSLSDSQLGFFSIIHVFRFEQGGRNSASFFKFNTCILFDYDFIDKILKSQYLNYDFVHNIYKICFIYSDNA